MAMIFKQDFFPMVRFITAEQDDETKVKDLLKKFSEKLKSHYNIILFISIINFDDLDKAMI